ncbi:MAG: hypothetical protein DWQ20_00795 [Actinobacteria bacterium]|nr:MAG: hypothetical protein DWQ20_00795 [Actinomycetota bacterium]
MNNRPIFTTEQAIRRGNLIDKKYRRGQPLNEREEIVLRHLDAAYDAYVAARYGRAQSRLSGQLTKLRQRMSKLADDAGDFMCREAERTDIQT